MDIETLASFFSASNGALNLFKQMREMLPEGDEADKIQKEIVKAEEALKASRAELAKALGYRLCRCDFPPEPMLWKRDIRKEVCPKCGDTHPPERPPETDVDPEGWLGSRR